MKIIYLKPKGAYKSPLRSDTLWGSICWSIRMVYGEPALVDLLNAYDGKSDTKPFYISSAFPYKQIGKGKIPYFPLPLLRNMPEKERKTTWTDQIADYQEKKKKDKIVWVDQLNFQKIISGKEFDLDDIKEKPPKLLIDVATHNAIDRVKLGSMMIESLGGQLFHEEERYWVDPSNQRGEDTKKPIHKSTHLVTDQGNVGLYFLAKGDTKMLEGAIRHLSHHGIGGNRSSGKGAFDVEINDFKLKEPSNNVDAMVNLSLYHPKNEQEISLYKHNSPFLYKLETRQGRSGAMHGKFIRKRALQMFKEGSVFPYIDQDTFGHNPIVATAAHKIRHYGMAFMIKMKTKA